MSDTVKSWIEERRAIHESAAESPWWTTRDLQPATVFAGDGSAEDIAVLTTFEHSDATAVVDAHNSLPRALDALNAVLRRHAPHVPGVIDICAECDMSWPCATVTVIESALEAGE